ncbi:MAG: ribosome biogenesis factor YjgA [Pseudomonadales bacterium]
MSKSARKREALGLQALGRQLTELKPAQLADLGLPERLLAAILDYQRFSAHEARRRQLQFIGRLMRDLDVAPIQEALDTFQGQSAQAQYQFHQLELWRERLLADPEALTAFLSEHPDVEAQQLRHRIAQVRKARDETQQRTASRALFRFLRDNVHPD